MSSAKKKPPALPHAKPTEEVNKRALMWIGGAIAIVVIVIAVLLVLDV